MVSQYKIHISVSIKISLFYPVPPSIAFTKSKAFCLVMELALCIDQHLNWHVFPYQNQILIIILIDIAPHSIIINGRDGKMILRPLPQEAQFSPIYGIEVADVDGDGHQDILLGGNLHNVKPEVGRYDASYGLLLQGDGSGNFVARKPEESGIRIHGEVRDMITLQTGRTNTLVISRNNDSVILLKPFNRAL